MTDIPPADRDLLRRIVTTYAGFIPGGVTDPPNAGALEACLAWQHLDIEIMTMHAQWLDAMKARAVAAGRDWTAEALRDLDTGGPS